MSALSALVVRIKDEAAFVEGLEKNDAHRRLPSFFDRPQRHRVRIGKYRAIDFFRERVDTAESLDRIWWDQLIPRHCRIDFIDPAKDSAGEIPHVAHPCFGQLARGG